VFCHKDYLSLPVPPEDVNFRDDVALAKIVSDWTTPYAATDEMHEKEAWDKVPAADQVAARGIEVGHIFHFGTKYSEPMGAKVQGPDGKEHLVSMGSYGIGPSRVVAAIIEASHDEAGIIWPEPVAPFAAGIINMKPGDAACDAAANRIYDAMMKAGREPLLDDTTASAGNKFATADLIGLPWQIIAGPRGVANGEVEVKNRKTGARENMTIDAAVNRFAGR